MKRILFWASYIVLAFVLAAIVVYGQQPAKKPTMVLPTVTHKTEKVEQEYDHVTVSCPEGYEGHYVDRDAGFDIGVGSRLFVYGSNEGEPGFTICFENSFMDEIRKHPEMLRARPIVRPA